MQSFQIAEHIGALHEVLEDSDSVTFTENLQLLDAYRINIQGSMQDALNSTGDANNQITSMNRCRSSLAEAQNQIKERIKPRNIFSFIEKLRTVFLEFENNLKQSNQVALNSIYSRLLKFEDIYEKFLENYSYASTVELLDVGTELLYALTDVKDITYLIRENLQDYYESKPQEESFSLFLESDYTYTDFLGKLEAIQRLYSELCSLLNVSESDFPLRLAKVESGSVFIKIFGESKVIDLMTSLVKDVFSFFYRNRTIEGRIASIPEKVEVIKVVLELKTKLQKAGVDTNSLNEELTRSSVVIAKELSSLLEGASGVKLNGEQLQIDGNKKQNLLSSKKQYMIEAAKSHSEEDGQSSNISS